MKSKWVIDHEVDAKAVDHLAKELAVPQILAQILLKRGIDSFDKAKTYFRPELEKLHDPFIMKGMDLGVERLHQALRNGEKILVFGDYDVDGVSGSSLLYLILSRMVGSKVTYYIPDRMTEGYGLSKDAVKRYADEDYTLILTIDCGVTAIEEVAYANSIGVDVIICDHHEPGDVLPDAVAILDPKQADCPYPFKELAGVGVGFKFMQGLYKRLGLPSSDLDDYMDIGAIGTCADIVPLVDENRILVRHGLDRINYNPRFGIRALLESANINHKEITAGLVVFVIAPRINAVGRMGDARRAVQVVTAESLQRGKAFAKELEKENLVRRNVDENTFKEALEIVDSRLDPENARSLVVYKRDWHPGVIGIVASRIVEKYYRPTIMISVMDGVGKASARSISNFNIYEAIKECSDHLNAFGGHKYAAGLTIEEENIPAFIEQFTQIADAHIGDEDLIPTVKADCEVNLKDFDDRLVRLLKLMGPFGPQNLRPVFMSRNLKVVGEATVVGNNHLKMTLAQNGTRMNAIGFNMGDKLEIIKEKNGKIDCVYVVEENHWNGKKTLQMRLKDFR